MGCGVAFVCISETLVAFAVEGTHLVALSCAPSVLSLFHCSAPWQVSQEAQPELVRAMSAAAARYGHVMFPENAHEPAVEVGELLVSELRLACAGRIRFSAATVTRNPCVQLLRRPPARPATC